MKINSYVNKSINELIGVTIILITNPSPSFLFFSPLLLLLFPLLSPSHSPTPPLLFLLSYLPCLLHSFPPCILPLSSYLRVCCPHVSPLTSSLSPSYILSSPEFLVDRPWQRQSPRSPRSPRPFLRYTREKKRSQIKK